MTQLMRLPSIPNEFNDHSVRTREERILTSQTIPTRDSNPHSVVFSSSCPQDPIQTALLSSSCPTDSPASANAALFSSSCPKDLPTQIAPFSSSCPQDLRTNSSWVAQIERSPLRPNVIMGHAFSAADIAFFASFADCHAIVSHGGPSNTTEFAAHCVAVEEAPVFVHETNSIRLSLEHLLGILRGERTRWSEVGGATNQRINVYLHGGVLQRRKFEVLLQSLGLSRSAVAGCFPRYLASYEELERASSSDPHSIAFGLKHAAFSTMRMVSVDGTLPLSSGEEPYPLCLPIFLLVRSTPEARSFEGQLRARLAGNRENTTA